MHLYFLIFLLSFGALQIKKIEKVEIYNVLDS